MRQTLRYFPALLLLVAGSTQAQLPALKVERLPLPNGLTVLALEDHTVPSIAYYTVFKVGSRNERPGITGISHLFEHMMFNGSAKFAPKVFDQIIEAGGGESNAFTNSDTTEYFEQFSSGTLDIVLRLEADRMRALKLDSPNLEQERGIVKEERRVNTDNSVPGSMSEILWNNAFVAHPYRWDTIGFMKDLDNITVADAKNYFRTYYAPNNAVVAVVGDFDTKTLFVKMKEYFGKIPRQKAPRNVINAEPEQLGEKRIAYHRVAELPMVFVGYHIGNFRDMDDPALTLLGTILAGGESSRLYHRLVYEKQMAAEVSAAAESRLDPGLFTFTVQAQPGKAAKDCEDEIYAVLKEVQEKGVSERELQKAKNGQNVGFIKSFVTNLGRAGILAEYEASRGGWRKIYQTPKDFEKVTRDDIQRVAKKYFSDRTRTVLTLFPEKTETTPTGTGSGEGAAK